MPALRRCGRMWEVAFGNGKEVQELVLGIALGGIHRGLARQDLATALEGVKPRGELVGGKGQRTGREKPYIPPRDASIGAAGGRSESERGSRVPCPISSFAATLSPTAATRERWARTEKAKVPCGLMGGGVEEEERQHVGGGGATFVLGLLFKCGAVEVDDNGRLSDRFGARHPNNALRRSRRAKEQSRGEPGPGGGTVLRLTQLARLQAGLDRIHANASPTGGGGIVWGVGTLAVAHARRPGVASNRNRRVFGHVSGHSACLQETFLASTPNGFWSFLSQAFQIKGCTGGGSGGAHAIGAGLVAMHTATATARGLLCTKADEPERDRLALTNSDARARLTGVGVGRGGHSAGFGPPCGRHGRNKLARGQG